MPCLPSLGETPPEETRRGQGEMRACAALRIQSKVPVLKSPQTNTTMNEIQHHTPTEAGPLHYTKACPKKANETHGEIWMSPLDVQNPLTRTQPRPKMNHRPEQSPTTQQPHSHASCGPNTWMVWHEGRTHGATHLLWQVFSPTTKPHLPKEYIDKAQGNIWACAQPHKNSMLNYPQYNDATHLPKQVPPLCDTPPGEDHTCCSRCSLPLMHETPPNKNTAKVQDQKWTCTATRNPIQEPNA
ncbi:hypothetical protein BS47DRAFT_1365623 [Hydnum rufescens UP504]|uniref:Uncharacterized protein n=1 Tax=Hydnum rufescens UP504 TaxID=1448309 RepID=A0A9P6AN55_9AGAM|nr:hypothetical protein BS47DRAFT_1365623 [Hydnum rufescens UP504]